MKRIEMMRAANVFGLDMQNEQHRIAIADAIAGIEDIDSFIEYSRDNKNSIVYASKVEKLDEMAHRYKKEQYENSINKDTARKFARELAAKVEKTRRYVEKYGCTFSSLLHADTKEKVFSDKELRALAETCGATALVVELSRDDKLEDEIYNLFVGKSKKMLAQKKYKPKNNKVSDAVAMLAQKSRQKSA